MHAGDLAYRSNTVIVEQRWPTQSGERALTRSADRAVETGQCGKS